ncbi:zf-C2HC5-domain-containing protein [Metschnikowia bicuspidata var. bicuspidata NRRL YB-4993]|uniref:Zf-C2HC5-domain-containing protein n=1 Tax=Metschnikowia bicuspidata var. bicuspidata NRRL YB-4993 TaxID=869754 RepID=A0A1A0GZ42_9ASCO|nr:zf-C2HC5-domain-containing protein [Metschnikowia bicuspidata var. bicuspidata NRRL YB-4993]OBA16960.1 zf-C2HC5-domain-containing protein [Metschnikowia bicuspidata var. bicuspidata NRRL YB-4993]
MAYEKARAYAISHVGQIIPLDKETCEELVNYTLTLPDYEMETHLLDLLGPSDETFKLISKFMDLKRTEDELSKMQTEKQTSKAAAKRGSSEPIPKKSNAPAWSNSEPISSKAPKTRLLKNKIAVTTSQLADMKPSNKLTNSQAKKAKKKNLDSLADIEAAINDLEVENAKSSFHLDSDSRRVCDCMATRHPLFEVAPNCLNCGKIICSKEGLQPCSSCGRELLSETEKREIIKILRSEKDLMELKSAEPSNKAVQNQPSKLAPKKIKYGTTPGGNLWKAQDAALKQLEEDAKKQRELEAKEEKERAEVEEQEKELQHYQMSKNKNPELMKAQERLETLLHFQETGAERSKIIDNASDFEMPGVSSGSMWLSPVERALQLKKQQKQLRKSQSKEKARTGRTKKVVEMVIRDGKVKMVEKQVIDDEASVAEEDEINTLEQTINLDKLLHEAVLSKNTWDPKKDQEQWEKPVYIPQKVISESDLTPDSPARERVQQNKLDNAELVAAMYS